MQPTATQPAAAQPAPTQPAPTAAGAGPAGSRPACRRAARGRQADGGEGRPAARQKTAPTRVVNPGDLVCGQCGEGNDPNRRFCRRCGASCRRAAVFTLPWYRRWWRRLTTRKTREAGDRPRNRRRASAGPGPGWLTSWGAKVIGMAVVVILVLLTFVGPWRGHDPPRREQLLPRHRQRRPSHLQPRSTPSPATATSAAPGHPAVIRHRRGVEHLVADRRPGTGSGQSLSIRLADADQRRQDRLSQRRPGHAPGVPDPSPARSRFHLTSVGRPSYAKT